MRVAAVTNRNRPGYPDENLADHLRWMRRAADGGVRLVLFPELSLSGYASEPYMRRVGMRLDDRRCRKLYRAARDLDLFVAFGIPLRRGRRLYICHVLAGAHGMVGHYEKVHLAGGAKGEGRTFSGGSAFRVFDADGVKVGINICFDGRHPASSLCLAHLGAEIILHPHGNVVGSLGVNPRDWTARKRAYLGPRAVDTCTYSLICNSVGDLRGRSGRLVHFSGGALILSPEGKFLARSPTTARRPHMVVADLDLDALRQKRRNASFAARRPGAYVRALQRP
jgi:predicted amidohydrolase